MCKSNRNFRPSCSRLPKIRTFCWHELLSTCQFFWQVVLTAECRCWCRRPRLVMTQTESTEVGLRWSTENGHVPDHDLLSDSRVQVYTADRLQLSSVKQFKQFAHRQHTVCVHNQKILNTHTHICTHLFNGPFSETTQVSQYQKGKTNLDFTEARDSEWQWHQLGHMQSAPCFRLITMPAPHLLVFYRPDTPRP